MYIILYIMDNKIRLILERDDRYIEIAFEQPATWPEFIDSFNDFISALGYIPRKGQVQFIEEVDDDDDSV